MRSVYLVFNTAQNNGLSCTSHSYQRAAGKHADVAALAAAHELGMAFTAFLMAVAAHCNKLAEVQYLHSQGCPWPARLLEGVARDGHFEAVRGAMSMAFPGTWSMHHSTQLRAAMLS
jgi:hypothetical protein